MSTKRQVCVSIFLAGALLVSLASCRRDSGGGGGDAQPPPSPTACSATATSNSVTLSWNSPGDGADISGFAVYQGVDSLEKRVGSSSQRTTIGNLSPGVQYHFDVRAYNDAGESDADACSVDVATSP